MSKKNLLITGAIHDDTISAFQKNQNFNVTYKPDCPREDLLKLIADAHIILSRSETTIDQEVFDHAKKLEVICRAAVGIGNIDIPLATERGILVINTPGKNTNSAAELTLGLTLSMLRNIPEAFTHLKAGNWDRHRFTGSELAGKTIGIVGIGNVGHRVAKFAKGFDMNIIGYDPYVSPELFQKYSVKKMESLDELCKSADIVTLHVPLNKETKGMINTRLLGLMKPESYIVNAARGGVVNELDLLNALKENKISGAAIDTFENEPEPMNQLVSHPKVWCTQHLGASTFEAQKRIGDTVYEQVCKAIGGGVVDFPVNLPEVGIPDDPLIKAYSILAQKLGALTAQIIDFNPSSFEINYRGEIAESDTSLLKVSFMKGYADCVVDNYVSFVNASSHFSNLGIDVTEKNESHFSAYKSAIKIIAKGDKELSVGGVVYDRDFPRISLINGFYFEIEPTGELLLIQNDDKPGVIGAIGNYMGECGVNIDSFVLSRNRPGGQAMALLRIDRPLEAEQISGLKKLPAILSVKPIKL